MLRILIYTDADVGEHLIEKCTKIYPKHQRLSPGLLVMVCRHKSCYGFEVMEKKESIVMVYNLLLKYFKNPPRFIVYDNACNLHNTCMIRYVFVRLYVMLKTFVSRYISIIINVIFLLGSKAISKYIINRFHSQNHCFNFSYSMKSLTLKK